MRRAHRTTTSTRGRASRRRTARAILAAGTSLVLLVGMSAPTAGAAESATGSGQADGRDPQPRAAARAGAAHGKAPAPQAAPGAPIRGEAVNVSGRLPQHRARVIKLQRKRGHRWVVVATSRTRRSGRYGFSTHAPAQRLVVYRVAAPRTSGLQAVTSRTLTVRPLAQHVGLTAPPSAAPSSTATLVVDAAPPRRGRRVSVQRLVDDVWVDQSTVVQAGGRRVSVAVSVPGSGLRREPEPSVSYRAVLHRFRGAPSLVGAAARVAIDRPADTTAPPVPSGLVVQPGNGQVGLAWDAVAGPGSE